MTTLSAPTSPRSARAATSARLPADQALHLVRRVTYGPTPALVHHVRAIGATEYLESRRLIPDGRNPDGRDSDGRNSDDRSGN